MHVNEMIYNRGDLASRSLAIATVAAKASGATWKRRNFVNFGFVLFSSIFVLFFVSGATWKRTIFLQFWFLFC